MIIRLAMDAEDIPACTTLDHSYITDQVWQMDLQEQSNGASMTFRSTRLPRAMHSDYPRRLDELMTRWEQGDAILVAEDEGQIVGYLHLVIRAGEGRCASPASPGHWYGLATGRRRLALPAKSEPAVARNGNEKLSRHLLCP